MLDLNTSRYFNSLPKTTQEIVLRSGVDFDSEEEMLNYISGLKND